ncbi:MAG: helix-turn-helix transcriptional regulator [Rhodoferax sp.]|nr:helix-turn-helix transcriptional regulator [Rhodoferax sp.]MDP3650336.1 helix-turn-helix transcriptional regulator [Rhodoferax sp.]
MDSIYQRFGQNIRKYRRAKEMSQGDLALLTNMGRPTIASIEKGRQAVALHQVVKLGAALDVDVAILVSGLVEDSTSPGLKDLHTLLNPGDFEMLKQLHGELP